MGKIISFSNQKGGVGKTTTCVNMAAYLAKAGKKVLLVDMDAQGNATTGLGFFKSELKQSVYNVIIEEEEVRDNVLATAIEGLFILPSNIDLAGAEVNLVYKKNRERVLKAALDKVKGDYDYILLDCSPSLGMLTINALAAADRILIPVQAQYLSAKGVEQLLSTVARVKRNINPKLRIDGVLLTMVDSRTHNSREISALLRHTYGAKINVFHVEIPRSVRAAEISAEGKSIFEHDPGGKVASAYHALTKEVLQLEKQRQKHQLDLLR